MRVETGRVVVIGVGRADRGDDAAGPRVASALALRLPDDFVVLESDGDASELIEAWHGARLAAAIDAADSGAPAGTIHRFDVADGPLPASLFALSSHGLGLAAAIELARALGSLPDRFRVWAIEGHGHDQVGGSAPIALAIEAVIEEVAAWLASELSAALAGRVD